MNSIQRRIRWASAATFFSAAIMAAGLTFVSAPAEAAFQLPEGEKITNLPAIPRAMPQKEAYELYDPKIGKNFDLKNFWMRADLRVRPEMRNGVCFGGGNPAGGVCNSFAAVGAAPGAITANGGRTASDFYVQQWVRLGIGYDLSPDVNFYMEIIDSATWGANGSANNAGNGGDPLNHNGGSGAIASAGGNAGRLGVRAAYMLVRNFAGVQGLSLKAGRQYVIFGNHSLFGHFDWANTGYSHDGIMLQYSTKSWDGYFGWFRNSEGDLGQAAPVGSAAGNVVGGAPGQQNASADADMFIFYNQFKGVPGFLIEPYYVYYKNNLPVNNLPAGAVAGTATANGSLGVAGNLGSPKHGNQTRHMIGNRIEMRKGNWDFINEFAYQFGQMGETVANGVNASCANDQKCIHINAWATRNWIGYTAYQMAWKPRLAFNFDYASGDGRNNCASSAAGGTCSTANTFENFFPTNHIHMGYMDVQAWRNMLSPSVNFQARPTKDDHVEVWYTNLNLASARDNWYRGGQGAYIISKASNTRNHIGDEIDFTWTHMFMDGKLAFQATYGHLFTGAYIRENLGTASNQSWAYVQLWMNF